MRSYDIVVIGAGVIGSSIAFELAKEGLRVGLLDRQPPGREASWAAGGMLACGAEMMGTVGLVALVRTSLALYPEFVRAVEEASGRDTGYRAEGTLILFFPPEAERRATELVKEQHRLELEAEKLAGDEARALEPAISKQAESAVRLPQEASVDNRALVEAVVAAGEKQGVEVRAGVAVTGIAMEKDRATGVQAGAERIPAGQVVVAAGCYTGLIPGVARYAPTRPVRGQMAALEAPAVRLRQTVRSELGYLVPRPNGRIVAGSTLEEVGYEKGLTAGGLKRVLTGAVEMVPALAGAAVVETWSGLRPDTPDHLPVLGPTDITGLSIATGHFKDGILLAPVTARLAREWITGQPVSIRLEEFSPLRFAGARRAASND
jgi:glycine oxidase